MSDDRQADVRQTDGSSQSSASETPVTERRKRKPESPSEKYIRELSVAITEYSEFVYTKLTDMDSKPLEMKEMESLFPIKRFINRMIVILRDTREQIIQSRSDAASIADASETISKFADSPSKYKKTNTNVGEYRDLLRVVLNFEQRCRDLLCGPSANVDDQKKKISKLKRAEYPLNHGIQRLERLINEIDEQLVYNKQNDIDISVLDSIFSDGDPNKNLGGPSSSII